MPSTPSARYRPTWPRDLADAGFFRLLLPRELGGAELAHPDFLRILELFAAADASVAWCLNQNNVFSTRSTRMPMATAREIWGERRGVVTNGPPAGGSKSVPVPGGYRLSGHWNFSSGSDHATWIAALAPVMPENGAGVDGQPPQMRLHLMPIDQVRMVDLWQVPPGCAARAVSVSRWMTCSFPRNVPSCRMGIPGRMARCT